MDPTAHLAHSLSERSYARMLLGAEHPLTRVLDRLALLAKRDRLSWCGGGWCGVLEAS